MIVFGTIGLGPYGQVPLYSMLIFGTFSALSVLSALFRTALPWRLVIHGLALGSLITVEAPVGNQDPFVISLVLFIIVFTIGEAIWSPRLRSSVPKSRLVVKKAPHVPCRSTLLGQDWCHGHGGYPHRAILRQRHDRVSRA